MATKKVMLHQPRLLHALLQHLTRALTTYICHQIDAGAQVCHRSHDRTPRPVTCVPGWPGHDLVGVHLL